MITKAIVEDSSDKYSIKVRIPFYDRASTSARRVLDSDLSKATVCTIPNTDLNLRNGDVVFVSFEDGDIGRPVIVGCLYSNKKSDTVTSMVVGSLNVMTYTALPIDTTIGDVSSEEIQRLKGLSDNAQGQIDLKSTVYRHTIVIHGTPIGEEDYYEILGHVINGTRTPITSMDQDVYKYMVIDFAAKGGKNQISARNAVKNPHWSEFDISSPSAFYFDFFNTDGSFDTSLNVDSIESISDTVTKL